MMMMKVMNKLLLTHKRPTPGKRMHYSPNKRDAIEEKVLKITEKQPD